MNNIKGLSKSRRDEITREIKRLAEQMFLIGFRDGQAASTTVEDQAVETIEHEGKYLQKVDRDACDDDYVRVQHKDGDCFKPNKFYGPVKDGEVKAESSTGREDYEMARVYNNSYGRYTSTVEVFEVVGNVGCIHHVSNDVLPEPIEPLTANQQRAKVIKRAREFVQKYQRQGLGDVGHAEGNPTAQHHYYETEFFVRESRITAVVYRLKNGKERMKRPSHVGRSFCSVGDVFNEWIGKAIAIAKALKIGIPREFLKAVQPTVAKGQTFKIGEVEKVNVRGAVADITKLSPEHNGSKYGLAFNHTFDKGWLGQKQVAIIDDTNAEYEVD